MKSVGCHSVKISSTAVGYSLVAMVTDLLCHLIYNSIEAWHCCVISFIFLEEHGIQCVPCSSQIISELQLEIHKIEKFDFLKSLIHSQII